MRSVHVTFAFLGLAVAAAACSQILGIEDAERDPLLPPVTGGAGGTGGSGGTGGGGTGGLCADYCNTVQTNCMGAVAVYPPATEDFDFCAAVCALLPQTGPEDGDNNIPCRIKNAQLATVEQDVQCPAAGPGGDGVCGTNCEAFCLLLEAECQANFNGLYTGQADCRAKCTAEIPDPGGYSINVYEGPTIQCRLYHLTVATEQPNVHCHHAAGDAPCAGMGGGGMGGGGMGGGGSGGGG